MLSKIVNAFRTKVEQKSQAGLDVPILVYHQVGREKKTSFPSIYVGVREFELQMKWLARLGYKIISLTDFVNFIHAGIKPKEKYAVITFDDGYEGVYQNAFPILQKHHAQATIFIIADRLANRHNVTSFPFLTIPQLREMTKYGVSIGSHSFYHKDLISLSNENDLRFEICNSKNKIEDVLGKPVQHLWYPLGRFSESIMDVIKIAGYKSGSSNILGRWNTKNDVFKLKRIPIGYKQTIPQFIYRIEIISRSEIK